MEIYNKITKKLLTKMELNVIILITNKTERTIE